jgi:hypothetical protein
MKLRPEFQSSADISKNFMAIPGFLGKGQEKKWIKTGGMSLRVKKLQNAGASL